MSSSALVDVREHLEFTNRQSYRPFESPLGILRLGMSCTTLSNKLARERDDLTWFVCPRNVQPN